MHYIALGLQRPIALFDARKKRFFNFGQEGGEFIHLYSRGGNLFSPLRKKNANPRQQIKKSGKSMNKTKTRPNPKKKSNTSNPYNGPKVPMFYDPSRKR
jgi:hypothetical protein